VRYSSVVHKDVDALLGKQFLKCFANLPLVCDIAGVDTRLTVGASDLLGGRLCLLRVDVRDSNGGAVGREAYRNRLPNAAAAARNDRYFAV
jgi:hypothetical protein